MHFLYNNDVISPCGEEEMFSGVMHAHTDSGFPMYSSLDQSDIETGGYRVGATTHSRVELFEFICIEEFNVKKEKLDELRNLLAETFPSSAS